jgi:hypothetical protein
VWIDTSFLYLYFFTGSDFSNWTVIGFPSARVRREKPTMSLNFQNMNMQEIKATVVHQFGHALGLGHALMKPDEWLRVQDYVDVRRMAKESHYEYGEGVFARHWTGMGLMDEGVMVNYDEKSVMRYR